MNLESDVQPDADLGADRIVTAEEVGLGGGLDQAEEAQLGVTDEEIEAAVRKQAAPRFPINCGWTWAITPTRSSGK